MIITMKGGNMINPDDPYGDFIAQLRALLREALALEGDMSDAEHANLIAIEELVRTRDNS